MAIIVCTVPSCPKCSAARALLKRKGIAFQEIDVQANHEKMQGMMEKLGSVEELSMPVLDIEGTILHGFEKEKILATLREKGLLKE